ncbi:MAG: substrate-binding domain-containing protein, partial [Nitrosospira sp.]|nr:substrate-binding domain-containing protein [Nitrosospira sp.]
MEICGRQFTPAIRLTLSLDEARNANGRTTTLRYVRYIAATAAILALAAAGTQAQEKKTLAIVVKGLDNPFFEEINLGCQDWAANNPDSEYECLYTGPASSADEAGQVQLVDDLITRGVAAIAISPSNAPAMANRLREIAPDIPVMTVDA